ncbi:FIST C-terminal domain-containing protein [Cyclobacteriaceae bacterium]|nr:FIST C-terminal domain-containing protein [Cyclobacteriaceae bacterium]
MKVSSFLFDGKWNITDKLSKAQLVYCFGARDLVSNDVLEELKESFPNASVISGSTAGEIYQGEVLDNTIVGTAIEFEKTDVKINMKNIRDYEDSFQLGSALGQSFDHENLVHLFVLSDGGKINGSRLVEGLNSQVSEKVIISGGLAGDGAQFDKTLVGIDDNIGEGNVVAVAHYGDSLKVGHASLGGWDEFGPERYVTKSEENVLYEFDDEPALAVYKKYLGDREKELPFSALLFPLSMREDEDSEEQVVRTVLSIDEEAQSMTFAGNIPEDSIVRFMKANFEKLIEASSHAAADSISKMEQNEADLVVYVSCVGRKLILGQRTSEEVEAAQNIIGSKVPHTGFYSYGEISPVNDSVKCSLHNQTMTITTYKEL